MNSQYEWLRLLVTVLLCALIAPSGASASTICGQITEARTGTPLYGATIRCTPLDSALKPRFTTSDERGRYCLVVDASGDVEVRYSFVGYAPRVNSIPVQPGIDSTRADAELTPRAIDMETEQVSASRLPERYVDAPASVTVMSGDEITLKSSATVAEHLQGQPGVDVSQTNMLGSNVVARGFNNVLSTSLLSFLDHRLMQIPSLRVNAYQFLTVVDEDIDRMEMVLGPGSALYGPNGADGILHVITRSPLASQGTYLSLVGGTREWRSGAWRHARSIGERAGLRISGEYFHALDWPHSDTAESSPVVLFREGPNGPVYEGGPIDNAPDREVEKWTTDVRLDIRTGTRSMLVASGGFSQVDGIELTDLGAAQIRGWQYGYGQFRWRYRDLFLQAYMNRSDAGKSYLRRSGARLLDRSTLYALQAQHGVSPLRDTRLTYGIDAQFTRPNTDGTLHGRNEQRDDIDAVGVYLQAEALPVSRLRFLVAGRVDEDNILEDPVISPRAAVTYQLAPDQILRATWNRAFGTPTAADLFLDVLGEPIPTADSGLALVIGDTLFGTRGAGAWDGFYFSRAEDGRPNMVSPFGPLLVNLGSQTDPIAFLPADVNSVWPALRYLAIAGDSLLAGLLPEAFPSAIPGRYAVLNPMEESFDPIGAGSISDVSPLSESVTSTLEVGYSGRAHARFALSASAYYTRKSNFVGPLQPVTPVLLIDSAAFVEALRDTLIAGPGMLDSAGAEAIALELLENFSEIPLGVAAPLSNQSTEILLARRNFGSVDLFGFDVSITAHVRPGWDVGFTYSYLSKDLFSAVDGVSDIALNAPRHKGSAQVYYRSRDDRARSALRLRWNDAYPVQSGVYVGRVGAFVVADLDLAYRPHRDTELALSISNLLNHRHEEFVGAPRLGRLVRLRISRWL